MTTVFYRKSTGEVLGWGHRMLTNEQVEKIELFTLDLFEQMSRFSDLNPDIYNRKIVECVCMMIGVWIANGHHHYHRHDTEVALLYYQAALRIGMEERLKELDEARGKNAQTKAR